MLPLAGSSGSTPLDIPAGPMLWTGPHLRDQDAGIAWFVGAENVLCGPCDPCRFQPFALVLPDPDAIGSLADCSVVPTGTSVVIRRLASIRLPVVGSSATLSVELPPAHFEHAGFAVNCRENSDPIQITILAASGQMTIRREREYGGSFDLRFPLFLDVVFSGWGFPHAILGPYNVEAKGITWTVAPTAESPDCKSCTRGLAVGAGVLQGSGTSPPSQLDDSFHLDHSEFTLYLGPACGNADIPSFVSATPWSAVKRLYRR